MEAVIALSACDNLSMEKLQKNYTSLLARQYGTRDTTCSSKKNGFMSAGWSNQPTSLNMGSVSAKRK